MVTEKNGHKQKNLTAPPSPPMTYPNLLPGFSKDNLVKKLTEQFFYTDRKSQHKKHYPKTVDKICMYKFNSNFKLYNII